MKSPHFTPQPPTVHNPSIGIFSDLGGGVTPPRTCEPGQARQAACDLHAPQEHTTTRSVIAALYTRPRSVYLALGLDCWGITRDATRYPGPGPIIAHPPCGHWGRYKHTCKLPGKHCGPIAVDQVRHFGGVLEHPASSQLFTYCGCPERPGQLDLHGGQIVRLHQSDYGHAAEKDTKLYIVGLARSPRLLRPYPPASVRPMERLSHAARNATPLRFALLLLAIASQIEGVQL